MNAYNKSFAFLHVGLSLTICGTIAVCFIKNVGENKLLMEVYSSYETDWEWKSYLWLPDVVQSLHSYNSHSMV